MKKGFTLIELLIVLAIIGSLLLIFIPKNNNITKNNDAYIMINNAKTLETVLFEYQNDYNSFPDAGFISFPVSVKTQDIINQQLTTKLSTNTFTNLMTNQELRKIDPKLIKPYLNSKSINLNDYFYSTNPDLYGRVFTYNPKTTSNNSIYSGQYAYSLPGNTWKVLSISGTTLNNIRYLNNKFYIPTIDGDFATLNGTPGTSINFVSTGQFNSLNDIAFNGTKFIAVGMNNTILNSSNGTTWTPVSGAANYKKVITDGAIFLNETTSGNCYWSNDGVTWNSSLQLNTPSNDLIWGKNQFVYLSSNQYIFVTNSNNASGWMNPVTNLPGGKAPFNSIVFNGNFYISVADNGKIYKGNDVWTWNTVSSPTSNNLKKVIWDGVQFIAVGDNGTILISSDGNSWSIKSLAVTSNIFAVASNGSKIIAITSDGKILISSN